MTPFLFGRNTLSVTKSDSDWARRSSGWHSTPLTRFIVTALTLNPFPVSAGALAINDAHTVTGGGDGVLRLFASDDVFSSARRGFAGLGGHAASTADSQHSGESCGQEVAQGAPHRDAYLPTCNAQLASNFHDTGSHRGTIRWML